MPPRPQLRIRANVLTRRRLEAALTRQQLADLSGVSRRRIEELENPSKEGGIQPDTARKLAAALGCPTSELTQVVEAA